MINEIWMKNYALAKKYYEEHGNLLIPRSYSLEVGGNIVNLGSWLNHQRQYDKENKLDKEYIRLLNEIGMVWQITKSKGGIDVEKLPYRWMKNYALAKQYYEEHYNLLVPRNYSVTIDNENINLGEWLSHQRRFYKQNKLNNEQISLLNKIGMVWSLRLSRKNISEEKVSYNWMKNYEIAKQYYEEHDNLLIPQKYYLIIDDKKICIGTWLSTQRQAYKNGKLSEKQIELLNKIGMVWYLKAYKNYSKQADGYFEKENIKYTDDKIIDESKIMGCKKL